MYTKFHRKHEEMARQLDPKTRISSQSKKLILYRYTKDIKSD